MLPILLTLPTHHRNMDIKRLMLLHENKATYNTST